MSSKIKRRLIILVFLIIISTRIIFHASTAPVISVAGDGSGDFNCDGRDDHIQINQALEYAANNPGTVVHLKGPFTYIIDSPLLVGNYTTLEGESNAVIKLADKAAWGKAYIPMIGNRDTITGNHDIVIQGFEINGNEPGQTDLGNDSRGSGYYPMICFEPYAYNITIQNMYFHNGCSDGARLSYSSSLSASNPGNIVFRNNTIYKSGHEGLYCIGLNNIYVYNNDVYTWVNSAFRLHNSNHAKIFKNHIHSDFSGHSTGPGIEIQRTSGNLMNDIEIYNNMIHTLNGAGIWMEGGDIDNIVRGSGVYIHHNIFCDVGQYWRDTGYSNAAIVVGQCNYTTIDNNLIINGGHAGIQTGPVPTHTQILTTIIRHNIIVNYADYESVGIFNNESACNSFISQNNYFYNKIGNSYIGTNITPSNDIQMNKFIFNVTN